MRLIWKKYDGTFDPIVAGVGVGFLLGGLYGVSLLVSTVLRHTIAIIVVAIPAVMAVAGALIIVREVQLYRPQRNKEGLIFVAVCITLTVLMIVGAYLARRR